MSDGAARGGQAKQAVRKPERRAPVAHEPVALLKQAPAPTAGVQRAVMDPGRASPADILALQRTVGNRETLHHLGERPQRQLATDKNRNTTETLEIIQRKWWTSSAARYNDTLNYLNGISAALRGTVAGLTNAAAHGNRISLRGYGWRMLGSRKRRALRALLLCLLAFGRDDEVEAAKGYLSGCTRTHIDNTIRCWTLANNTWADAADQYVPTLGAEPVPVCHTATREAPGGFRRQWRGNCYGGAVGLIYLKGLVSIRWLLSGENRQQRGMDPKGKFGPWSAQIATAAAARIIPAGCLVYLRRAHGVHYAVTVNPGECWAHNNPDDMCVKMGIGKTEGFDLGDYLDAMQEDDPTAYVQHAPATPLAVL